MKHFFYFIVLTLVLTLFPSCRKEKPYTIPEASVDIYIYTNNPSYINLTVTGGWMYVGGGVRGILVYRKSSTEFMAYERNCTYQSSDACATVTVDKTNIIATDTCCHSEFLLTDGSVIKAPASLPLKVYRNTYDGNVLHIYN